MYEPLKVGGNCISRHKNKNVQAAFRNNFSKRAQQEMGRAAREGGK